MERNHIFKRLLLITIEEVNDALSFIHEKMQLSDKFQLKYEISDIFKSIDELNLDAYKQILNKHFDIIRNALELFDEASFVFGEKLFVCWTDITDALTSLENKNSGILK